MWLIIQSEIKFTYVEKIVGLKLLVTTRSFSLTALHFFQDSCYLWIATWCIPVSVMSAECQKTPKQNFQYLKLWRRHNKNVCFIMSHYESWLENLHSSWESLLLVANAVKLDCWRVLSWFYCILCLNVSWQLLPIPHCNMVKLLSYFSACMIVSFSNTPGLTFAFLLLVGWFSI